MSNSYVSFNTNASPATEPAPSKPRPRLPRHSSASYRVARLRFLGQSSVRLLRDSAMRRGELQVLLRDSLVGLSNFHVVLRGP